jgi:hypothetical protein
MHASTDSRVFAFGIFAHDNPVEFLAGHRAERRRDPGQNSGWPHVGVLVEGLADREAQAPQRDVVGNVRMAGRAKQDRVVVSDLIAAVLRHHPTVLLVVLASPIEVIEGELHIALPLGECLQHFYSGRDHFRADPIPRDGGDFISLHCPRYRSREGSAGEQTLTLASRV